MQELLGLLCVNSESQEQVVAIFQVNNSSHVLMCFAGFPDYMLPVMI